MSQASEEIARQYAKASVNKKNWGAIAYNVLSEGLFGDGVTDDTVKLQVLINRAISEGRKTILFPHGSYYVTSLTNADKVEFVGDSSKFVGGYSGTIGDLGGVAALQADNVVLKPSGSNDTNAWNNAVNSLGGGGVIYLTHGDYFIDLGLLKSNITVIARGDVRILSDTTIFSINSGSSDVANNYSNIIFESVTFEAITKAFLEHVHLISLNGVSNITFKNCTFKGFRGDGVYLGSGGLGQERHNKNIHFEKCVFDGVANKNRNGISVIDVDGLWVSNCILKNCTASNMPGAIDIEPNQTFSTIRNIRIRDNEFENVGGNAGAIGVYLQYPQSAHTLPVKNISIEGNKVKSTRDTQIGIHIRQVNSAMITNQTPDMNLKILNNDVSNCSHFGAFITGVRGVELKNNSFVNNANGVILGSADATVNKVIDAVIEGNKFFKTTGANTGGILIYTADNITLKDNQFNDCKFSGIIFITGTSSYVIVVNNTFSSPTGNMSVAIERKGDHTFTPATNIEKDNYFGGLINHFLADKKEFFFKSTYDTTKLPDSFVIGEDMSMVDGDAALPSAAKQGILKTIRPIATGGAFNKYTIQWFYPANNDATTLSDMYFRKGLTSNAWSAWKKLTGV